VALSAYITENNRKMFNQATVYQIPYSSEKCNLLFVPLLSLAATLITPVTWSVEVSEMDIVGIAESAL
jgi:hypothetical protein